jgi:hypothetical protein
LEPFLSGYFRLKVLRLPVDLGIKGKLNKMFQNKPYLFLGLLVTGAFVAPRIEAAVTLAPSVFTLAAGQSLPFTIAGAPSSGVHWTITPALGTLSGGATSAVYTAPATVTPNATVEITATTVSTPITVVRSWITLIPALTLAITPTSADVMSNNQQTFSATVTGSPNTAVTWSASPGTISSSGVYTAPTVSADTTATVTARAQANSAQQTSATVRLHSRNGLWFTTQANGLQELVFNGINYNYLYGEQLLTSVTTVTPNGSVTVAPNCTTTFNATIVSKNCTTTGSDSVSVSVAFSTPGPAGNVAVAAGADFATIQADIQFTNNSSTDTISQAVLSILGVSMAQFNPALSNMLSVSVTNPVAYVNYQAGQWAIWASTVNPAVTMGVTCGWSYICKNQPLITNIAPHQTISASYSLRFTDDTTAQTISFAPDAYTAYRTAYPPLVNWPDRRPIMNWFIADTGHQSATNPRGYLWNPALDVTNVSNFQAQAMAQAESILSQIQARPVKPQGIIIWDLEGEEFVQATTYVGDPRVLAEGYAPEMNATADGLFALFKNAGLKVGMTLRPQQLLWGATQPTHCTYSADTNYKDYFINVNAPFLQKFYGCYDPAGLVWSLVPRGNGGQTFYTASQTAQVTALLLSKVAYAHSRWGATLYYVDTTVSEGGAPLDQSIFRALQAAYPDCLFIPEESTSATMGVAMPYSDPSVGSDAPFSPVTWRYIYPSGADAVYMNNCTGSCWTNNVANFEIGQKVGDIPIYTQPTQISAAQLSSIESMITTARNAAGSITVTDSSSGAQYSYKGTPATVYQYPVKMRVYFAASAASLPTSTTYCESGSWLGSNTCSLNLAGLGTAQIRYYDFTDQLVVTESAQSR